MSTPSIVSRFNRWIRGLPYPSRNIYLLIFVLVLLYAIVGRAIAGVLPSGQWTIADVYELLGGVATLVAILVIYQYLDGELSDAIDQSRPLSPLPDEQFAQFKSDLSVVPLVPSLIVALIGLVGVLGAFDAYGLTSVEARTIPVLVEWVLVAMLTFGFAYSVIRLVIRISRFYAGPLNLSIYNVPPLYELPNVAGKGGLFLLLIWYANVPFALEQSGESIVALIAIVAVALIPLAAFVLPHSAVSRRLAREKTELIIHVNQQLEQAFKVLDDQLQTGRFENLQQLQAAIQTLKSEKQFIEAIPTWPWRLGTFRLALTAVVLPILVWVIQQVLDRFFA